MAKSSRSDTHLPRLSRTTSITSEASHSSDKKRPKPKERKRSGESVEIVDENGKEVDPEEEGWESGDDESKPASRPRSKGIEKAQVPSAADMRRTVSDTQAEVPPKAEDVKVTTDSDLTRDPHHSALTQRTTGFAGTIHTPAPDPAMEAQALKNVSTPHYNDPTHVMPSHQIRHQQSSRSIHLTPSNGDLHATTMIDGDKTPKPGSVVRTGSSQGKKRSQDPTHMGPGRTRSTEGSGLPSQEAVKTSPSFPFPNMQVRGSPESIPQGLQQPAPPTSTESIAPRNRASDPPLKAPEKKEERARLPSGAEPRLRHRYSNSSIRSIQSLRAPPHPLNSPSTSRRSAVPNTAPSSAGSTFNSPSKTDRRAPPLHQPPIAAPVVYKEVAVGEGWELPEDGEASRLPGQQSSATGNKAKMAGRKASFSSQRSLQGLMGSSGVKGKTPTSSAIAPNMQPPQPSRRRTALEVATAAARLHTTSDPVEYHHSLGYPATSAETAHLISRFLPTKKAATLPWDLTAENVGEQGGVGLSRGAYRDAHESLIRMMKETGISRQHSHRPNASRSTSYHGLLAPVAAPTEEQQVGVTRGRNGTMSVAKGGWTGKTPFELSVERCMAQRPRTAGGT